MTQAKTESIDWGLGTADPLPQRRLLAVVQALWVLWQDQQFERCLRSLPLLAEKLDDCGLHYEAAAANMHWKLGLEYWTSARAVYWHGVGVRPSADLVKYVRAPIVLNHHRLFWFPPGKVTLSVHGLIYDTALAIGLRINGRTMLDTEVIHPTHGMLHIFNVPGFEDT